MRIVLNKLLLALAFVGVNCCCGQQEPDFLRAMQFKAAESKAAAWGRWGDHPTKYSSWTNHSNRLIPIYTFGLKLDRYTGDNSSYRSPEKVEQIYGRLPDQTVDPKATYMDQTEVYDLQKAAFEAGKKNVILIVFDGMDWPTTRAAAIYRSHKVAYENGYGSGLAFLDYDGCPKDAADCVTSPHNEGTRFDVDSQTVSVVGGDKKGGYSAAHGGYHSWSKPASESYLLGKLRSLNHVVTDSSSSATSLTTGEKTYNAGVNVNPSGERLIPLPRELQQRGFRIGVVTSVPISHATPACAYANNVSRDDYQDLSRDLLGLPSISNRDAMPGVDVLIGCGWGETKDDDREKQGKNFEPGNKYLADSDLKTIDREHGGRYVVAQRTAGESGAQVLAMAANLAKIDDARLFGFFGHGGGHLPYQTADGKYDPTRGNSAADRYGPEEIEENPTLADMAKAALTVLGNGKQGFWLMIEAGDVDWANHNNNIDDSIGAVFSGEAAFTAVTQWIEANSNWDESAVIVTADHGHFLVVTDPQALSGQRPEVEKVSDSNSDR